MLDSIIAYMLLHYWCVFELIKMNTRYTTWIRLYLMNENKKYIMKSHPSFLVEFIDYSQDSTVNNQAYCLELLLFSYTADTFYCHLQQFLLCFGRSSLGVYLLALCVTKLVLVGTFWLICWVALKRVLLLTYHQSIHLKCSLETSLVIRTFRACHRKYQ